MQSCLGLYIEDNLIKYAKVSKNNENVKVEAFGVKFYDSLNNAVKQIVEETYSFKDPISINTTDEWYNNIGVFSLLNKKDMESVIKTEFENICYDKEINKNIYEQRYIFTNANNGGEKIKVIHIAVPKTTIEQRKNQFSQFRVNSIIPASVAINNLIKTGKKGTSLIVNIEKDTSITKITNGIVSDIKIIGIGAQEILEKINIKENSYAKAYEICKNSTIYTETDKDLQYEENEYLEDIMPTLFQIVSQVRKTVDESLENIEKIYITGTGSLVNNIDIYFQDYLKNISCEILKPSFVNSNSKINIKDYIEVNSAIAIGLQGLEKNNKVINFKSESKVSKTLSSITSSIGGTKQLGITKSAGEILGKFNRQFDMFSVTMILITAVYLGGVIFINNQFDNKIAEAEESINSTNQKINEVQEYNQKFNSEIETYESLIKNIDNLTDANTEDKRFRNTIPNLLNKLMVVMPKPVQLVSIENTKGSHIVITARSRQYQQIAYFKTKLDTEEVLENVVSDTGKTVYYTEMVEGVLREVPYLVVTIEGELP